MMEEIFGNLEKTIAHLRTLHHTFTNQGNFPEEDLTDYQNYLENLAEFNHLINHEFVDELYKIKGRQMILADFIEYIFLGRMYVKLKSKEDKEQFISAILRYVNMLMIYETMTVSTTLRREFINDLGQNIDGLGQEELFTELHDFIGKVGLPEDSIVVPKELNKYFDTLLPKTAGGLWHELLVFIFMMRSNFGYIIPLLLSQRLIGRDDNIVPPDYLLIAKDKRLYGVEVGTKKEIQSGSFSIRSGIPTATIDTINSRNSDRCPICGKWILFCPFVIKKYSNLDCIIESPEVRCLNQCDIFTSEEISRGACNFTKYSRNQTKNGEHTHHDFATGYHYHYKCVLNKVAPEIRELIIQAQDGIALKTHFPNYAGLEYLNKP